MTVFIVILPQVQWSGIEPVVSLRYVKAIKQAEANLMKNYTSNDGSALGGICVIWYPSICIYACICEPGFSITCIYTYDQTWHFNAQNDHSGIISMQMKSGGKLVVIH